MILTYRQKLKLNKKQTEYFNKAIAAFDKLSETIDYYVKNDDDPFNIYNYLGKDFFNGVDKFALVDTITQERYKYRKTHKYKVKKYNSYELINSKNNMLYGDLFLYIFGFGEIHINDRFNNIPPESKIYKIVIKKAIVDYDLSIYYVIKTTANHVVNPKRGIGLDYSIYDFYVSNDGSKGNFPDVSKYQEHISALHKHLITLKRGSNNYLKCKNKISKLYSKIKAIKNTYLQSESTRIVRNYDLIAVEQLELKQLCKKGYIDKCGNWHAYGKQIYMTSYNKFVEMLDYKCKLYGKELIKVDKYFPSSKKCNNCGYINDATNDINKRIIKCPSCGKKYDRDVNAAKNILEEGQRIYKENE